MRSALEAAHIEPHEVKQPLSPVSSTGIAGADHRRADLLHGAGSRPDVKRIPLFGLGCVAGAAGLARVHDYLRGFPQHVAVLLSVELCSLTLQRDDTSIPALIGVCLFGDGAAAVVATGADTVAEHPGRAISGPTGGRDAEQAVSRHRRHHGVERQLERLPAGVVARCPADGRRSPRRGDRPVPGRPRLDQGGHHQLDLPSRRSEGSRGDPGCGGIARGGACRHSWQSMRDHGNISSASVLDVLGRTLADTAGRRVFGIDGGNGPGLQLRAAVVELVGDPLCTTCSFLLVGAERLVELAVSRRNASWSFANGGREFGRGHYPAMVSMHVLLLVSCVVEVATAASAVHSVVGLADVSGSRGV